MTDEYNCSVKDVAAKTLLVRYFALLREERGLSEEMLETKAATLGDLYAELRARHGFSLGIERLRVAVKDAFVDFDKPVEAGMDVIFVPPVAGG